MSFLKEAHLQMGKAEEWSNVLDEACVSICIALHKGGYGEFLGSAWWTTEAHGPFASSSLGFHLMPLMSGW